jgi:hypothetical protein
MVDRRARHPWPYPWEWLERRATISCPSCQRLVVTMRPSRRRTVECPHCGAAFNSFTGRVLKPGRPLPPPPPDTWHGAPTPLRPLAGQGGAAAAAEEDEQDRDDGPDQDEITRRLAAIPPRARRDLLRVLTSPSNVRADVIRQFYEREEVREMAEVLIDLEEDEVLRAAAVEVLKRLDSE